MSLNHKKLQKREENENKIKELMKNNGERITWADIIDRLERRTVEKVIENSLKERDNNKNKRQNRRRNIIIFELPKSKKKLDQKRGKKWILRIS